ncbi:MAG: spermidine/putrescine transport system substrate-binding protein [Nocardioidaceae bacterium]|jgi:spermidine/putrescine transport system substrate-binding protein|nr:spermidine/putrescine transport system substrate-binding protein [Nocardioidaceae bacterium]
MSFDSPADDFPPPRRRPQLTRRDVLRGGLWISVGVGAAPLLAACNKQTPAASQGGGAPYQLARPDHPVTLPIKKSNTAIGDGLKPETGGTFKILNYADYMAPGIMKDFGAKYDVKVQVTPYTNYDQMLSQIREPGATFDLVFPGPSVLSKMVYADLLQPLNRSYLPNVTNVWPEYQDPWFDRGGRYTVPYTVYTTGVGYRADRVSSVPEVGYDLLWDKKYAGKVYVLDDPNEAIGMSLLRNNITTDINTSNAADVQKATDKLIELISLVNVKTSISGYTLLPEGTATVHQTWSGDMVAAQYYLPKGETPDVLGYWIPGDKSQRVIGNDVIAIPKAAAKPVLAHAMINNLLDNDISLRNFGWNGYQPPITKLSPKYLIANGYVPKNLVDTVVLPADFKNGLTFYEVSPSTEALWRTNWARFKGGA